MLILLEGPELAGKTTLAERLRDAHGFTIIHQGPPKEHVLVEYERTLELAEFISATQHIVLDRWHVGELIYGPLLRGRSRLDAAMKRHVDLFLQARGCVVVILNPDVDVLDERWATSYKEQLITWTQELEVRDAYQCYGYQHPETLRWANVNGARVNNLLVEAEDRERRTRPLREHGMYVGPYNPDWLFVGDRPARTHRNGHLAAFVPYEGTSGHFLLTALLAHDDDCGSYGITNANADHDTHALWETLGQPNTIALGHQASTALKDVQVPHATAPHPQFVRRFHHSRAEDYGRALVHAVDTGEDVGYCLDS